jgi:hypothetical protein
MCVARLPNKQWMVSSGNLLLVMDSDCGIICESLELGILNLGNIMTMCTLSDGLRVIVGYEYLSSRLYVWGLSTRMYEQELKGHDDVCLTASFSCLES